MAIRCVLEAKHDSLRTNVNGTMGHELLRKVSKLRREATKLMHLLFSFQRSSKFEWN